jgi:hypothetical protein
VRSSQEMAVHFKTPLLIGALFAIGTVLIAMLIWALRS